MVNLYAVMKSSFIENWQVLRNGSIVASSFISVVADGLNFFCQGRARNLRRGQGSRAQVVRRQHGSHTDLVRGLHVTGAQPVRDYHDSLAKQVRGIAIEAQLFFFSFLLLIHVIIV